MNCYNKYRPLQFVIHKKAPFKNRHTFSNGFVHAFDRTLFVKNIDQANSKLSTFSSVGTKVLKYFFKPACLTSGVVQRYVITHCVDIKKVYFCHNKLVRFIS